MKILPKSLCSMIKCKKINSKIESLSSSVKNQLSFNKMIKTQLAQIASAIAVNNDAGRISGQTKTPLEFVKIVSTSFRECRCFE